MEELLSTDYDQMEKELYVLTRDEIENAVIELNNLKNKYSRKGSALLLWLCKNNIIDTITLHLYNKMAVWLARKKYTIKIFGGKNENLYCPI